MAGLEVEYLARSALPYTTGTEYIAGFVPRKEDKLIGIGNLEGLSIHLFCLQMEVRRNACGDRMGRIYIPNDLMQIITPEQVTGCTDYRAEYL